MLTHDRDLFKFENILQGQYFLIVQYIGYETQTYPLAPWTSERGIQ